MDRVVINRHFPCCGQTVRIPDEALGDAIWRRCKKCGKVWRITAIALPLTDRATVQLYELAWSEMET